MSILPRFYKGVTLFFFLLSFSVRSQTKIVSSSFSSFNVNGENMCTINISNTQGEVSLIVEATITNNQGNVLIKAISEPLTVTTGVYNTVQLGMRVNNITYQSSSITEYIKLYHQLPSGKYNYCVNIKLNDGSGDELCDAIESENSSYLTLVNPMDKDTIETYNPVLIWNHSESFSVLQQGEYYRLIVSPIKSEQGAEVAINVNTPFYQANFLTRHDVLYPLDAPKLISGERYAWQVQKIANGVITNKTEAWEFVIKAKNAGPIMVVEITPKLNNSPYIVNDDKIHFLFNEEYNSAGQKLNCIILNNKGEKIEIKKGSDNNQASNGNVIQSGLNRYEINLAGLGLKNGDYLLKIFNEKNQVFLLKFIIK